MSGSTPPTITEFTPGDIVISVVGDDNNSGNYGDNQAAPIELEEIDPSTGAIAGELILAQTTTVNAAGVTEYAISGEYGSSSEGSLELAANGESLVIAGYGVNAVTYNTGGAAVYGGGGALAQTTSEPGGQYTPVARVIADISYNGTVDTSTALFNVFNVNNPRSVATINGSTFYISGQGDKTDPEQGVYVTNDGSGTQTQILDTQDTRTVEIVNGELYVSYDSKDATPGGGGIDNFGSTLPASETSGTMLPGIGPSVTLSNGDGNALNNSTGTINLSPENFFFADAGTLYIADGGQPKEGGAGDGGLQKWTYNSTSSTWQLDYTLTAGLNLVANTNTSGSAGLIGMTAVVNGGSVTFYVTNSTIGDLDQTYLYTITDTLADTTALQASGESFSVLETAAADTNIRGVAFAPADTTPVSSTTIPAGTTSSVTVTSGSTLYVASGGAISASTILSAGIAYISGTDSGTYVAEGGQEVVSGSASHDTIHGTQVVASGGVVSSEAVFSNGLLGIASGGTASNITVNSGGTVMLSGGGTISGLTLSGGTVYADTAADAIDGGIVFSGAGEIVLSAAGLAAGTVISGFGVGDGIDLANIGSGASLISTFDGTNTSVTVTSGGVAETFVFSGAYASGYFELTGDPVLTVNPAVADPIIVVSSGVTSSGLTIASGQSLIVSSGGTAISTTIQSGGSATVSSGGADRSTTVLSGGNVNVIGTQTDAIISSGGSVTINVVAVTTATNVSGSDTGTTILAGGTETVLGSATGDQVYGTQIVETNSFGGVGGETVYSGGIVSLTLKGETASGITVKSGGSLVITGSVVASNTVLSGGTLVEQSPKTLIAGSLDFVGGGTLELTAATNTTTGGFGDQAPISGFIQGAVIDLAFLTSAASVTSAVTTSGGNTLVTVSSGTGSHLVTETFIFAGGYSSHFFALGKDSGGDVELVATASTPCFAAGTRLLGLDGEIPVEAIQPGDVLVTLREGGPLSQSVIWTGQRAVNLARHPEPHLVRPVRIIAGAFAPGVPERDLRLSPDHAVYVDGCLFTAASLINGETIYQETACARVTYHHIELASHDILLAEGLPVESFLDTGNRDMFASMSGPMVLHPDFAPQGDAGFCAPMIRDGEVLAALRERLAARAARFNQKRA